MGVTLLLGASAIALAGAAYAAGGGSKSCGKRSNNNIQKITECVTLEGVRAHQAAFQQHADDNGGNRAAGFPGYDASVQYVVDTLTAAGYAPVVQPFDFIIFSEVTDATLSQTAPVATDYTYLADFFTMSYSGSGSVTAPVTAVDLSIAAPAASTSGCEADDFAGFPAGNIALIQRGACTFALKAENAADAGAVGVIIFNQGVDGRTDLFGGTLSDTFTLDLPVVSMPFALGAELAQTEGLELSLTTDTLREPFTTVNVLAETTYGDPSNVVMVGAHLDSVDEGPGVQDNGSGSAAILEVAVQIAKAEVENKVRFAWWGAEESGLVGSTFYVDDLVDQFRAGTSDEIFNIAMYLNFDMIGSPNYVFKIYDGDDSDATGAGPGPAGSAEIEQFFEAFYEAKGEPYKGTDFSGRSDYNRFIFYGIPAGGLFTGAEEVKTEEEAAIWGGTAGAQLDPCYHEACDTFDNISLKALDINSDAAAASTLFYAMNTSDINGVASEKGNFVSVDKALSKVGAMKNMDMLGTKWAK
jgi:aminopeptidase Y